MEGTERLDIRDRESFIESTDEETIRHGAQVLDIVAYYSPGSMYSLYQAVESDRTLRADPFDRAVDAAIQDEVDILNISAGDPWPGPVDLSPSSRTIERAIENDIVVVAAAGNSPDSDSRRPIHCPAAVEEVIAVGGFVADCTSAACNTEGDGGVEHPDGTYWAHKRDEVEYPSRTPDGVFCGQQGCDGSDCIRNQHERPWEGNVLPTDNKPDILAPVHYPEMMNGSSPYLQVGSSFAAPVVTGTLGMIFGELIGGYNETPSAWDTRQAIRSSAVRIDEGDLRKLNVQRTLDELAPDNPSNYSY